MTKLLVSLLLFFLCMTGVSLSRFEAKEISISHSVDEPLYLPNGQALEVVALGFKNVLGDVLWFNTISYFGKHFRTDQKYQWFAHMCNLVADLDPKAEHVYRFCAVLLSWELNAVDESNALLSKAISAIPQSWLFPYLRGFNYLYFKKDSERAHEDLVLAATKPNVHPMVVELAAKQSKQLDDPIVAIRTIQGLMNSTSDPAIKGSLQKKIDELRALHRGDMR